MPHEAKVDGESAAEVVSSLDPEQITERARELAATALNTLQVVMNGDGGRGSGSMVAAARIILDLARGELSDESADLGNGGAPRSRVTAGELEAARALLRERRVLELAIGSKRR
jgi:hypothetical protein